MFDAITRDAREVLRRVGARPSYAIVTIATLTLVIGAASAVIAVVNATLIRPLPYPEAHRLARIYLQPPGTTEVRNRNPLSTRALLRFRAGYARQVESVEGFAVRERALGSDGDPESVPGAQATPGALALLGGPLIGRTWTVEEDQARARVVVISHALWQRRFGGAPDIVGRRLLIDREWHEVIGVMPADFHALYLRSELWTPMNLAAQPIETPSTFIATVARLGPGATVASLHDEVQSAMHRIVAESPAQLTGWTAGASGIREAQFGTQRPALVLLMVAVVALTLIACANLANVTLAEIISRRGETALRTALGASRARIVRLQLLESLLLTSVGALVGVLVGAVSLPWLLSLDPQSARALGPVTIDWRVQTAVALVTVAVACVSGALPMLREFKTHVVDGLSVNNPRTAGSVRDGKLRRVLVGAEAALAVVLLACGGVLLSAFQRSADIHPGFDATNVLAAQARLSPSAYPNPAARSAFVQQALDRIRAVPGVLGAATTTNPFVPGSAFQSLIHIEGRPTADGQPHTVHFRRVSPGYFGTMRIPLVAGRDFEALDGEQSPLVAIVSRRLAEKHWPGQDPIGRRVVRSGAAVTVVGVVGDVSDVGFGQAPDPTFYVPYTQNNPVGAAISLVVRTTGDPLALAPSVRAAVLSVDPAQPIDNVGTLEQFLRDSLGPQRFRSTLLLILAALGLALAAVGIYGVTARAVQERTREVGVRLALGAAPGSVWRLVAGTALLAVAIGVVVGLLVSLAASVVMTAMVPGVEHAESSSAVAAVGILVASAVTAAAVAARRAVRVDPVIALRS